VDEADEELYAMVYVHGCEDKDEVQDVQVFQDSWTGGQQGGVQLQVQRLLDLRLPVCKRDIHKHLDLGQPVRRGKKKSSIYSTDNKISYFSHPFFLVMINIISFHVHQLIFQSIHRILSSNTNGKTS